MRTVIGVGCRVAVSMAVGVVLLAGGAVQAATVSSSGGDSLLNPGTGFKKFNGSVSGKTGDVVLAKKSTVTVSYENGCIVEVKPGAVYTIETPEGCLAGVPSLSANNVLIGGAVVGGVAAVVIIAASSGASP